jgi:hypothetical protein
MATDGNGLRGEGGEFSETLELLNPGCRLQVVSSWVAAREAAEYRPILEALFKQYMEPALEFCRSSVTALVKQAAVTQAQTVCSILEGMLPKVHDNH